MSKDNKPKREPASLAFRLVATYFWPFTSGKWYKPETHEGPPTTLNQKFRNAACGGARMIGRNIRFAGVFAAALAAHQIIQPTTALLFPSGEDYLSEHGIDPKIARELSDRDIRVRGRDILGRAHAIMDIPTLLGMPLGYFMTEQEANAFAVKGFNWWGYGPYKILNQCNTYPLDDSVTAKRMISAFTGIPEDSIENVPINDKETKITVALHEFAHCHNANRLEKPLAEADADARGVWKAAAVFENPEIIKTILYARAMATDSHSHDVVLYLDAKLNGKPLPTAEQMPGPTDDAFALAKIYKKRNPETGIDYMGTAIALKAILENHGDLLSDLGKRRAELYIEAVQYFVPSAKDKLTPEEAASAPAFYPVL